MCKIILALDQSSKVSAFAVNKGGKILEYGKFIAKPVSDKKPHKRIMSLQNVMEELVLQYKPDAIYLEDVFKKGSIAGFKTLSGCLYTCINTCLRLKVPYKVIGAGTWRKGVITSKKRAEQKAEAIVKVKELFDIETTSDDIAEAILMSMYDNKG